MSVADNPAHPAVPDDDSTGFAAVERDHVRRFVPDFDWLQFDAPSPRVAPTVPLARARIALVSTAGAHEHGTAPMPPAGEIRRLPGKVAVELTHPGYDTRRAALDLDTVYPVGALTSMAEDGVIGSVAPSVVSTMGFMPKGDVVLRRLAPQAAEWLAEENADLALLVPA